jgi:hypothetical protein
MGSQCCKSQQEIADDSTPQEFNPQFPLHTPIKEPFEEEEFESGLDEDEPFETAKLQPQANEPAKAPDFSENSSEYETKTVSDEFDYGTQTKLHAVDQHYLKEKERLDQILNWEKKHERETYKKKTEASCSIQAKYREH